MEDSVEESRDDELLAAAATDDWLPLNTGKAEAPARDWLEAEDALDASRGEAWNGAGEETDLDMDLLGRDGLTTERGDSCSEAG